MKSLIPYLLLFSAVACQPSSPLELYRPVFYDVNGLLQNQASKLSDAKVGIFKHASLDTAISSQNILFYDSLWKHELEIFKEIDLNSPALKALYQTSETLTDSGKWVVYTTSSTAESKVEELKIFFPSSKDSPEYIQAIVKYQNTLFTSYRTLDLHFEEKGKEGHLLKKYEINGWQIMIASDTVRYSINGKPQFSEKSN
ncbi:MAG: hypothetical protein ACFCUU_03765 [Cyclobacteriaceae bacterium]